MKILPYSLFSILFIILFIIGCNTFDKKNNLIGQISIKSWKNSEYWNEAVYFNYIPDSNLINLFKDKFNKSPFSLIIFSSIYCDECTTNIPQIIKILEEANIPADSVNFYGLDQYSSEPSGFYKNFKIESTPAVFLVKAGSITIPIHLKDDWLESFLKAYDE